MKKNKFIFKEVTSHELYGVLQDLLWLLASISNYGFSFNIKEVYNVK